MSYYTDFVGSFRISPPITDEQKERLQAIAPQCCGWQFNDAGEIEFFHCNHRVATCVEFLTRLNDEVLKPIGHTISGGAEWFGEDKCDRGAIIANKDGIAVVRKQVDIRRVFSEMESKVVIAPTVFNGQIHYRIKFSPSNPDDSILQEVTSEGLADAFAFIAKRIQFSSRIGEYVFAPESHEASDEDAN